MKRKNKHKNDEVRGKLNPKLKWFETVQMVLPIAAMDEAVSPLAYYIVSSLFTYTIFNGIILENSNAINRNMSE